VKTWCFVVKCVVNVVLGMAVSDVNTTDFELWEPLAGRWVDQVAGVGPLSVGVGSAAKIAHLRRRTCRVWVRTAL
jgi:hypothetical protein